MRGGQVVERAPTSRLFDGAASMNTRARCWRRLRAWKRRWLRAPPRASRRYRSTRGARSQRRYRLRDGWLAKPRRFTAVDSVSLDVADGEALGIVGESGSGKSTLTRALMRLTPAAAGDIVWLGRPMLELQGEALRSARDTLADRVPGPVRQPRSLHDHRRVRRRAAACACVPPWVPRNARDSSRRCWSTSDSTLRLPHAQSDTVGRAVPAGGHRARHGPVAPAAGLRRGGECAGCVDPGADPANCWRA